MCVMYVRKKSKAGNYKTDYWNIYKHLKQFSLSSYNLICMQKMK